MTLNQSSKKEMIIIMALALLITFMDITGMPASCFINVVLADVSPIIFTFMINFLFIGVIAFLVLHFLCPRWKFGFQMKGIGKWLKRYAPAGVVAGVLSVLAFWLGLRPLDYVPTIWKVLFEGIIYYVGVGIIEEIYVRGLFLNWIEKLVWKSKNKTRLAIIISSVVFGLGHIPGVWNMGLLVICFKLISTIGLGLYFGVIYKKTENLLVPIIMHIFIDICALPYCFTTFSGYKTISLCLLLIIYGGLGVYSLLLFKKD